MHSKFIVLNGGLVLSTVVSHQFDTRVREFCEGLSVWSLHGLLVSVWVLFVYYGFLPQFKDMQSD